MRTTYDIQLGGPAMEFFPAVALMDQSPPGERKENVELLGGFHTHGGTPSEHWMVTIKEKTH